MQKILRITFGFCLALSGVSLLKAMGGVESAQFNEQPVQTEQVDEKPQQEPIDLKKELQRKEEERKQAEQRAAEALKKKQEEKRIAKLDGIYASFKNNNTVAVASKVAKPNAISELREATDYATYEKGDVKIGKEMKAVLQKLEQQEKKQKADFRKLMASGQDKREVLYQGFLCNTPQATAYLLEDSNSIELAQKTASYAIYEKNDSETGKIISDIAIQLQNKQNQAVVRVTKDLGLWHPHAVYMIGTAAFGIGVVAGKWVLTKII